MNIRGIPGCVSPIGPSAPKRSVVEGGAGFGEALDGVMRSAPPAASRPKAPPPTSGLTFSRHATARMESRGINLDSSDLDDLSGAIDNLARRGAKESLILLDDHAFIVGIPDRKVITALTRREAVGNIFTQIDSTMVVR